MIWLSSAMNMRRRWPSCLSRPAEKEGPWDLEAEMRETERIHLLNPPTPELLEDKHEKEGTLKMLSKEVVKHSRNEIDDLYRSLGQGSARSEEQAHEVATSDVQDTKKALSGQGMTEHYGQGKREQARRDNESANRRNPKERSRYTRRETKTTDSTNRKRKEHKSMNLGADAKNRWENGASIAQSLS